MSAFEIKLPSMGEGVHEASIVSWLKKVGDPVNAGEPLVEVSTDKVDTELSAPSSGYLIACLAKVGENIGVGQLIGFIGATADTPVPTVTTAATGSAKEASEKARAQPATQPHERGQAQALTMGAYAGPVKASPLARKMARDLGINLGQIRGEGRFGRVNQDDVLRYAEDGAKGLGQAKDDSLHRQTVELKDGKEFLQGVAVRREKMSKVRRLTAEHMLRSVAISPHVTTTFEMDLKAVSDRKARLAPEFASAHGLKLTYTAFMIEAAISALKEFPIVNASVDGDDILFKESINIGCAVAAGPNLIVPVIKNAESMNLVEICRELSRIVDAARSNKLSPSDIVGGTFTITNPGMFGSLHSQPIINQPQVAILSVGAIVTRPMFVGEKILPRPMCQIGLTFDHRIIDGQQGALFLKHFDGALQLS